MSFRIEINAENGVDAASQFKAFLMSLQLTLAAPVAPAAPEAETQAKAEDAPAPKAKRTSAKKQVSEIQEKDEEDAPSPRSKPKARDEDEEAPTPPKKKAEEPGELVDDGEDQPATIDGCRIMIRRVARTPGLGPEHSRAILAEFGISGAKSVPEKKIQKFIDRCQEVIEDPESIDV